MSVHFIFHRTRNKQTNKHYQNPEGFRNILQITLFAGLKLYELMKYDCLHVNIVESEYIRTWTNIRMQDEQFI